MCTLYISICEDDLDFGQPSNGKGIAVRAVSGTVVPVVSGTVVPARSLLGIRGQIPKVRGQVVFNLEVLLRMVGHA